MTKASKYAKSLSDLEHETRVDPKDMVEEQTVSGPPVYVEPADLDRSSVAEPDRRRTARSWWGTLTNVSFSLAAASDHRATSRPFYPRPDTPVVRPAERARWPRGAGGDGRVRRHDH